MSQMRFKICDQVCITFADGVTEDQVIESQLTRYTRKVIVRSLTERFARSCLSSNTEDLKIRDQRSEYKRHPAIMSGGCKWKAVGRSWRAFPSDLLKVWLVLPDGSGVNLFMVKTR